MSEPNDPSDLTALDRRVLELLGECGQASDVAAALSVSLTDARSIVERTLGKLKMEPWLNPPDPLENDHPHTDDGLEGEGLLAHLRFRHVRGFPRYHLGDSEDLPRLHRLLHKGPPRSYA